MRRNRMRMGPYRESEKPLISWLGVYGIWLLKHAKNLDRRNIGVKRIAVAYDNYRRCQEGNGLPLIRAIDEYCQRTGWERPHDQFEDAANELYELRNPQVNHANH